MPTLVTLGYHSLEREFGIDVRDYYQKNKLAKGRDIEFHLLENVENVLAAEDSTKNDEEIYSILSGHPWFNLLIDIHCTRWFTSEQMEELKKGKSETELKRIRYIERFTQERLMNHGNEGIRPKDRKYFLYSYPTCTHGNEKTTALTFLKEYFPNINPESLCGNSTLSNLDSKFIRLSLITPEPNIINQDYVKKSETYFEQVKWCAELINQMHDLHQKDKYFRELLRK